MKYTPMNRGSLFQWETFATWNLFNARLSQMITWNMPEKEIEERKPV